MDYDLLWSMDEYQSLLDYKWNSFHYINMFINENITNREKRFSPKAKVYPQTPEEFKKAIETIIKLYTAIKKNYTLNGSKPYPQALFRGLRKNSNTSYFASTSQSIETAVSFMNGGKDNGNNDVLVEIEPSQVAWIDLESFVDSRGADLDEKEILFLPCEYQTQQETSFMDYIAKLGITTELSNDTRRKLQQLKGATYRKAKLVAPNYKSSTFMSLDALASRFEQYRQNLIKLSEAVKNGQPTTLIEKDIMEFKKFCSGYLKSQFNKIDMELQKQNAQTLSQGQLEIDRNSTMQEIHIGNTGRMFSIQSPEGVEKYYFKPAESKDKVAKPYRAHIQAAAYNVQRIVNPARAVKCNTVNINGTFGAIQEKIEIDKDATKKFHQYFYGNGGKLDSKLLSQILDEYLVDYCLCNYDAHAKNFVIDNNGNLRGIDKEQSFRYIDKDATDDMLFSQNYNEEYGESETIYATIFKKMASGEISYKVLEGLNYRAARLAQIPDEQYRQMFQKYASSKTKTPQEAEMLLDRIVERKKAITKKVDLLKQDIYQKSQGKMKGTEEYVFTDNITQKSTPIKRPYIRQEVVNIVTGKPFQRQEQTPWAGEKKEKEELIKQRQDLRRAQFAQRTQQMGLGQKQVPNLNDIFQQQRQQQIRQQQMQQEMEEETEHGMSM